MKHILKLLMKKNFLGKKWIFDKIFDDIEIYEKLKHLRERLESRYKIKLSLWERWTLIKTQIIILLKDNNCWEKCLKKNPYQKSFTIHLTDSNIYVSGIIQNDLDESCQRIYFSTFLPKDPSINPNDLKFDLSL